MRFKSLDGLRGIAALVVVASHLADASPAFYLPHAAFTSGAFWMSPFSLLKYTPLRILVAGRASVLIFFVLSGFVLYISQPGTRNYGAYLIKRLFRIYPTFAFSIGFAILAFVLFKHHEIPRETFWFNSLNWSDTPTTSYVAHILLMTGVPEFPTLNTPIWSLTYELRVSIAFPLLVVFLRHRFALTIASFLIICVAALGLPIDDPVANTIVLTFGYGSFFVAGAALAMSWQKLVDRIHATPSWIVLAAWLMAYALLISPMTTNIDALAPGLGAILLIALCLASPAAALILQSRPAQWLGRISYSLYLLHVPILLAVIHAGSGRLPAWALLAIAVCLAFISAECCNRLLELPLVGVGRRLASRVESLIRPGWPAGRGEIRVSERPIDEPVDQTQHGPKRAGSPAVTPVG
jgi:peptidoglycan/LPS O-acetylase OafA/YrhL